MSTPADIAHSDFDFADRAVVTLPEIAAKWRCSLTHVWNQRVSDPMHLVDDGRLTVLNVGTPGVSRPSLRVPISAYRIATAVRLSRPAASQLFCGMPRHDRAALLIALCQSLEN